MNNNNTTKRASTTWLIAGLSSGKAGTKGQKQVYSRPRALKRKKKTKKCIFQTQADETYCKHGMCENFP